MNIEVIKKKSVPILRKYGIQSAAIFGSAARGEDGPDSDIDFLVRLGNQMGVYKFIGLKYDLQEALGKNVDLVLNGHDLFEHFKEPKNL